jgi:5-methylthioadenosine/S-adenosylhomocysteine deaminase
MTNMVTVVRGAAWVVAWDESASQHVYMQDADIVFSKAGILYVGPTYEGHVDEVIAGASLMVMPGFVNIHCHSGDEPIAKGLFEDVGTAALWGNALYEYSALIDADDDAKPLARPSCWAT